ncbi:MAG TPA: hypothetical protein VFX92_06735 [Candidatus Krumholzibacteria bacterium]|nr:hypothetical protein [Candidatus Krumholzibacteria bacterium]
MKRILLLTTSLMLVIAAFAYAGDQKTEKTDKDTKATQANMGEGHHDGSTVTLTGEVLDMYCYMSHPESATGEEHAKCANSCLAKGLPIGFLTADGTVYMIVGSDHTPANDMVKDWVGKQSTITGKLMQHKGMKAIDIASISAPKS